MCNSATVSHAASAKQGLGQQESFYLCAARSVSPLQRGVSLPAQATDVLVGLETAYYEHVQRLRPAPFPRPQEGGLV